MSNSLNSNLETLFSKMENFVTTKTVVGEPVHIGGIILVPLVDVVFGVGAGATSANSGDKGGNEVGGGGLGAKITPSAVIVIINDSVQLVNVKNQDSVNKLIDMVPGVLSKFNLDTLFSKKKKDDKAEKVETNIKFEETVVTEEI